MSIDVRILANIVAGATPRLAALGLGMEDLIADVGGAVGADALYFPAMQTLYAALMPAGVLAEEEVPWYDQ